MSEKSRFGQASRIIIAGIVAAVLITLAGALAVVRVHAAQQAASSALDAHNDANKSVRLLATFLTERESASEYLAPLQNSASLVAAVASQHAAFGRAAAVLADTIAPDNTPAMVTELIRCWGTRSAPKLSSGAQPAVSVAWPRRCTGSATGTSCSHGSARPRRSSVGWPASCARQRRTQRR